MMTAVASLFVGTLFLGRHIKLAFLGRAPNVSFDGGPGDYLSMVISEGGMLIAGSWLALALTRRLRRERGWIDALGMTIGAAWIVADLTLAVCTLILI